MLSEERDRSLSGERLVQRSSYRLLSMFGKKRDRSLSIDISLPIVPSIVSMFWSTVPEVRQRDPSCAVDREITGNFTQLSPPLSSMVSLTISSVRQRERSLAVDKEISGDRVIDCSQCSATRDHSLSIQRSMTIIPSIVSMLSPTVPNVSYRVKSFALEREITCSRLCRCPRWSRRRFSIFGNETDRLFSLERLLVIFSSMLLGDLDNYSQ